jgi:hypothetical protein
MTTKTNKIDRFLASLTNESGVFGLLGDGHGLSFYKMYVRTSRTSKAWWKFETGAAPTTLNPMKYQAEVKVSARAPAVWAPLVKVGAYGHHPDRPAIGKLLARAKELAGSV